MPPDTRKLDAAGLEELKRLVDSIGGRRALATRMAIAKGNAKPSKEEIESQTQRLRRVFSNREVTIKTLDLVAIALENSLQALINLLFDRGVDQAVHTHQVQAGDSDPIPCDRASQALDPASEAGRLHRLLNKTSELTASRTNLVRDEPGLPAITLQNDLYVRRDIEDELARALEAGPSEAPLIILDGEAGTGKSSILWATERGLKAKGVDAWLLDATELTNVLGANRDGAALSDGFRALIRTLSDAGRPPVLLIDTIDVPLNVSTAHAYVISLLTELAIEDVTVIAASRPGEARMLSAHKPFTLMLFDYSDDELTRAVVAYARAFVRDDVAVTSEMHAANVLEAAAQGYPIKEICRNPLTLRMLYAIYAPQEINLPDVDVVTLYREFWRRRVESDLRTDVRTPNTNQIDLSDTAMRIAIAMLVAGAPELPKDRLAREIQAAGLHPGGLDQLQARGVISVSHLAPDHLTGFFHQTFFEHGAALALLRLGGPDAIAALAARWAQYGGNLFLAAILERVLILSEYELPPVQQEAARILAALPGASASGKAILAYVFVHRSTVPETVVAKVRAHVESCDTLTVERLLLIGANAARPRRSALIGALGIILLSENSRWIRRALELLLRFASLHLSDVRRAIRDADIGTPLLTEASKYKQSRDLYLRFLKLNYADDPEWTLRELARYFSDAIKRHSEQGCLDVLEATASVVAADPKLVRQFEALAGLDRPKIASQNTSDSVSRRIGDLYLACWKSEGASFETGIDEAAEKRGLAMMGRLYALGGLLLEERAETVARAFQLTGNIADTAVRIMAARTTWTQCLPVIIERWPAAEATVVTRHARTMAGDVLGATRNGYADILFHVARHGRFSKELVAQLLGEQVLAEPSPWLDTRVLGHRLIQGTADGIVGAEAAFKELTRAPGEHQLLARAALVQLKTSSLSNETQVIALRLAVTTDNIEAATDILKQIKAFPAQAQTLVKPLSRMAELRRRTGNPKSMRLGSGLVFELVRLDADPELSWKVLVSHAEEQTDDLSIGPLLSALGMIAQRSEGSPRTTRLRWLLDFSKEKDISSRLAVLEIFGETAENDAEIASDAIEDLFNLAFKEKTDGNLVEKLQAPLFSLYEHSDPRATRLAEALVERSASLPLQACHRICGTFKRVFGLIVERMDDEAVERLLSQVPRLNRRLGRMIVEGVARAGKRDLAAKLKAIVENPENDPEIVALAGRFLRRELRASGIDQWPELYRLVNGS